MVTLLMVALLPGPVPIHIATRVLSVTLEGAVTPLTAMLVGLEPPTPEMYASLYGCLIVSGLPPVHSKNCPSPEVSNHRFIS